MHISLTKAIHWDGLTTPIILDGRPMGMKDGGIIVSTMYYCKACYKELYYQFNETSGRGQTCYVCGEEGPWGKSLRVFGGPVCDSCIAAGEYDHNIVDHKAWVLLASLPASIS